MESRLRAARDVVTPALMRTRDSLAELGRCTARAWEIIAAVAEAEQEPPPDPRTVRAPRVFGPDTPPPPDVLTLSGVLADPTTSIEPGEIVHRGQTVYLHRVAFDAVSGALPRWVWSTNPLTLPIDGELLRWREAAGRSLTPLVEVIE